MRVAIDRKPAFHERTRARDRVALDLSVARAIDNARARWARSREVTRVSRNRDAARTRSRARVRHRDDIPLERAILRTDRAKEKTTLLTRSSPFSTASTHSIGASRAFFRALVFSVSIAPQLARREDDRRRDRRVGRRARQPPRRRGRHDPFPQEHPPLRGGGRHRARRHRRRGRGRLHLRQDRPQVISRRNRRLW